jgi:mannose-6-phosphate isomerase-like protein (cupin superfamily)
MAPFAVHELKNLHPEEDLIFLDVGWENLRQAVDINNARPVDPGSEMHLKSLDKSLMGEAYGAIAQGVHPWPEAVQDVPFSSSLCVVEPGKTARAHKHQEHETFLIISGQGRMRIGDESVDVGPGDAILMGPFDEHELSNLDQAEDLIFIDLCWEDMQQVVSAVGGTKMGAVEASGRVVIPISPGPSTELDAVTFGAEVHARYLSMRGIPAAIQQEEVVASPAAGALLQRLRDDGLLIEKEEMDTSGQALSRLYFPLSKFDQELTTFFQQARMDTYLQAHCEQLLAEGLPDVAVSATTGEGVPMEGFDGTADLRFARALAWVSSLEALPDTTLVPFFDASESFLHAVLIPGLLLAIDAGARLPQVLRPVSRLKVEGGAAGDLPARALGFCLAHDFPEVGESEIQMGSWEELIRRELIAGWEGWLKDFDRKVKEAFASSLPGTGAWTDEQQRFFRTLTRLCNDVAEAYEAATFSPQRVSRLLSELVDRARRFGRHEKPWSRVSGRYEEWRTAVAIEALAAKTLALLAAPIMPEFAADLWRSLGLEGTPEVWEDLPAFTYGRLQGLGDSLFSAA